MPSKTLKCKDCSGNFEFTEGEQKFYADKGFQEPRRRPGCREKKKVGAASSTPARPAIPQMAEPKEKTREREVQWIGGDPEDGERRPRGRRERIRGRARHYVHTDDDSWD